MGIRFRRGATGDYGAVSAWIAQHSPNFELVSTPPVTWRSKNVARRSADGSVDCGALVGDWLAWEFASVAERRATMSTYYEYLR